MSLALLEVCIGWAVFQLWLPGWDSKLSTPQAKASTSFQEVYHPRSLASLRELLEPVALGP